MAFTNPLPQVQEDEKSRPGFLPQNKIEELESEERPTEQQTDEAEQVEAPSKFSKFFGKYFK